MFLAKPEVIERLNAYFVPVFIDDLTYDPRFHPAYWKKKAELGRTWPYAIGPSVWIIAPDGRCIRCFDVQQVQHHPDEIIRSVDQVIKEERLVRGEKLVAHVPGPLRGVSSGDLSLHVVARFLVDREMRSLDPRVPASLELGYIPPHPAPIIPLKDLFEIRRVSPVDEWCVLGPEQQQALLPPASARRAGAEYVVPSSVSAKIYRHLCPPTFNAHLGGSVLVDKMRGVVVSVGKETYVQLNGTFACQHRLWGGDDENVAEGTVAGYLSFDSVSGKLLRFGLTTDPGIYGDHKKFRVPFVATAQLQDPSATDAIAAGAPSTAQ